MATFTVFTRARPQDLRAAAEGRVVFVREGFSWLTLLFAPLVLLAHRLWLALAAYLAVLGLMALATALGAPEASTQVVMLGFNLLLAFELSNLRARKLRRLGYEDEGVVIAPHRDLAEQRFFAAWSPRRPAPPAALRPSRASGAPVLPGGGAAPVIGAFPGH